MSAKIQKKRCYVTAFNSKTGEYYDHRSAFSIDGTIDTVIKRLQKEKKDLKAKGWSELALELDSQDWSDDNAVFIRGSRMETQAEADHREAVAARDRAARLERERRDYERLKAQFGE